jgi:hypothetical protein
LDLGAVSIVLSAMTAFGTEGACRGGPPMSFDWGASGFNGDTVFGPSV